MRRWAALLLVTSLAGCSTPRKVVRLDTGQGEPSVHVPRRGVEPVEVSQEEFKHAVAEHAPSVPAVERPLEYAGRLFGVPERSGWFWYEGRTQRLMAAEPGSHRNLRLLPEDEELKRCYLLWCERTWGPGDCLRLLVDKPFLDGDAKYAYSGHLDHPFRLKPITRSGRSRSPVPSEADHRSEATLVPLISPPSGRWSTFPPACGWTRRPA